MHQCQQFFQLNILGLDPYHHPLGDFPYAQLHQQLLNHRHPYLCHRQLWLRQLKRQRTIYLWSSPEQSLEFQQELQLIAQYSFLDRQFVWRQQLQHHQFDLTEY